MSAKYSDCVCILLLTNDKFIALEDNYDDTYTEWFNIPINKISSMSVEVSTNSTNSPSS